MKLIFLDIDGVLTTKETDFRFSSKCIENLLSLIRKTDAKIVICSSWKEENLEKTLPLLPSRLYEHVLAQTPNLPNATKGKEVQAFLHSHPFLQDNLNDEYIILDDEPELYLPHQVSMHFIQTDINTGLTEQNIKKATKLLTQ